MRENVYTPYPVQGVRSTRRDIPCAKQCGDHFLKIIRTDGLRGGRSILRRVIFTCHGHCIILFALETFASQRTLTHSSFGYANPTQIRSGAIGCIELLPRDSNWFCLVSERAAEFYFLACQCDSSRSFSSSSPADDWYDTH